jgi:hypothetical protein
MGDRTEAIVGDVLWRRLDAPGHDACRLAQRGAGWTLEGAAVFSENGMPAWLTYQVACDAAWRTRQGEVRGWQGGQRVEFRILRTTEGVWTLNGTVVPELGTCLDLDLGFTPATNLLQIRRTALVEGQAADVPVAWLDVSAGTLEVLQQRYERRSATTYWYVAPRFDYAGLLEVDPVGFIRGYPGLWQAEPSGA